MKETLQIVVPSRRRSHNMRRLLRLVPSAIVCVDEVEMDEYREHVPEKKLLPHPSFTELPSVRNWINANVKADAIVQMDDDLIGVNVVIGKVKRIKDPETIRQIIHNTHQIALDLNINVFCWSRCPNPVRMKPSVKPFRFNSPMAATWGVRGAAKLRQFDSQLIGKEDFDFTLYTLRDDRILFCDMRFYFDHGRAFAGRGGNVDLVRVQDNALSDKLLKQRWGRCIDVNPNRITKGHKKGQSTATTTGMSVRVSRQSPLGL